MDFPRCCYRCNLTSSASTLRSLPLAVFAAHGCGLALLYQQLADAQLRLAGLPLLLERCWHPVVRVPAQPRLGQHLSSAMHSML